MSEEGSVPNRQSSFTHILVVFYIHVTYKKHQWVGHN